MSQAPLRVPPHNEDAERSVLGALLLDNRVLDELAGTLKPEDFYREAHRHIFRAMSMLHTRSEPIDVLTLADFLSSEDNLEAAGGPTYLTRLSGEVPSAANVGQYSRSEERRVGKECRSRWSPEHDKKTEEKMGA